MPGTGRQDSISPPATDEYHTYYGTYIDKVDFGRPILELLEAQGQEVQSLLAGIDDRRGSYRYGEGKWSIKQVVGHLIDTERVFAYRGLCFSRGDRQPLPGMDQDEWVDQADFDSRSLGELMSDYQAARRATVKQFAGFSNSQLLRRGIASGCEFTARATVYIIAGHERHHLEVLRSRYRL